MARACSWRCLGCGGVEDRSEVFLKWRHAHGERPRTGARYGGGVGRIHRLANVTIGARAHQSMVLAALESLGDSKFLAIQRVFDVAAAARSADVHFYHGLLFGAEQVPLDNDMTRLGFVNR